IGQGGFVYYELADADFGTAKNVVDAINASEKANVAQALDGRRIAVKAPESSDERVAFLGRIENLPVKTVAGLAKVIVNPRTGSVVMNQRVGLEPCAVAHGNLSVVVDSGAGAGADIQMTQANGSLMNVKAGTSLAEVVKALNALGANPMDLLAILQAMKAAGALRAELEII
ncbi:MAG: flagellar basal body P-ring protein FlgI, partial [Azonexus sp.]|nr:flagellar basal body P-ring protein FlgI [Azonexus sp.]